jgi:CheY-like chemotaxis protein
MNEPAVSLASVERLGGGLPIAVRLRVGLELLRSVVADPSDQPSPPSSPSPLLLRTASSRLLFERVAIRPGGEVCATGPGDTSGAALVLWEIFAGRPLEAEPPVRLHDIVDDMPADVDDLMTSALRAGAPPITASELLDELSSVAEPYAVTLQQLWDCIPHAAAAPVSRGAGASPASVRGSAPVSSRGSAPGGPRSVRSSSSSPPSRPSPVLLLIHAGEEGRPIAAALRGAGYTVVIRRDGAAGLAYAIAENPTGILCDSDLPDTDGEAVVRRLRREPSAVATVPFVLIASRADTRRRIARFGAGADICVLKPFQIPALIHQVEALVDMSSRLRAAHRALPALPAITDGVAVTGDLRLVGIGAMLTILEMERRTGSFVATGESAPVGSGTLSDIDPQDRLELDLARGCVGGAWAMGQPARPLEVLRSMMRLSVGRFSFKPAKARYCEGPSLSELLTDAARLEDEAAAGR